MFVILFFLTAYAFAPAPIPDPAGAAVPFEVARRFLLTSLSPARSMINNSRPKMTPSVTMAPITPATARDMPPPEELVLELEPDEEEDPRPLLVLVLPNWSGAHVPVLLPQALHQASWPLMLKLPMPLTKSDHGSGV